MSEDTPPMKLQIASWICIAVNLTSSVFYAWMINRTKRLRERDKQALDAAIEDVVEAMGPAVIFCAMMRDSENVPDPIRKVAANAIPKNVTAHGEYVTGKRVVH